VQYVPPRKFSVGSGYPLSEDRFGVSEGVLMAQPAIAAAISAEKISFFMRGSPGDDTSGKPAMGRTYALRSWRRISKRAGPANSSSDAGSGADAGTVNTNGTFGR